MKPKITGLDHTWRILCVLMLLVVAAEAWYVRALSIAVNDQRIAQSIALDRHRFDQYLITKLRLELRVCAKTGQPAP